METRLQVRKAVPEDYFLMETIEEWPPDLTPEDLALFFEARGDLVYAVEVEGQIIALLGCWIWSPGMGLGWGAVDQRARKRDLALLIDAIRRFLPTLGLRRLEATSPIDFVPGHRWLRALGFRREGLMHAYGEDGSPHWRYAMVFPSGQEYA